MTEDNQFFRPVKDFCKRGVVHCSPGDALVDSVRIMREKNISSIVVCADDKPLGIFTDRDLRNKIVADDRQPGAVTAGEIMNSPLATIGEDDYLYQALYRMSRHGIHRLGVVDARGRLTGIITDTDILRVQAHSPHQLVLDIEKAADIGELREQYGRIQQLALHLSGTAMRTRDTVRLIAHLNDQILVRLSALLRAERFSDLPASGFAFVVLGSEGRGEQTLSTDQDNAIVYADDLDAAMVERIEAYSIELIDALISLGVPPCPGGIMAKNAPWRRSRGQWIEQIDRWLMTPSPENVMSASMFADIRTVDGDPAFERDLKAQMVMRAKEQRPFLMYMAKNMTTFRPPLSFFGGIKTPRSGAERGRVDVKKAGIFAITDGVKALALEAGLLEGSTSDRLQALVEAEVLDAKQASDLDASFEFLVRMRLRGQVEALRGGERLNNLVALDHLNRMERGRLLIALEEVKNFQGFISRHFKLDLLR